MSPSNGTAPAAHPVFDARADWGDFPASGFPVTGTLVPASGLWTQPFFAQVWSADFSQLIVDNIPVTFNGPAGTWEIDTNFTGTLVSGTTYQLVVSGTYSSTPRPASQQFTKQ
jgi:hypothetical protein